MSRAECCCVEWIKSQQCPVTKAIIIISVIGTPRIQSNIERIMVSFMSCNKIIRLLPYEFFWFVPRYASPVPETPAGCLKKAP